MIFKFCKNIKLRNASNSIISTDYPEFKNIIYPFSNEFIKTMNRVNPQVTGRIIELIISNIFVNQNILMGKIYPLINDNPNLILRNIIMQNQSEFDVFVKQINELSKNILEFPVNLQEDLSFKKLKFCYRREYRCFADVTTSNTILDIKVVRKSFFLQNSTTKLSKVGLQYFNQLMIYACGFNYKYDHWPEKLILFNCYTGEIITWTPSNQDYIEFNKRL